MSPWVWVPLAVVVYFIGFTIMQWENYRNCGKTDHAGCKMHGDDAFISVIWPLALVIGTVVFAIWLPFGGGTELAKRYAARPTREQKRERALREDEEREARIAVRTKELEAEIKPGEVWVP